VQLGILQLAAEPVSADVPVAATCPLEAERCLHLVSVFHSCATLDYLGISALISTSVLTLQHQGLRCRPSADLVYGTATCVLGCLGLYLPWKSWFNKRENKNYRISFFLALSAAGVAPMLHISALYGVGPTWRFFSTSSADIGEAEAES